MDKKCICLLEIVQCTHSPSFACTGAPLVSLAIPTLAWEEGGSDDNKSAWGEEGWRNG